MGTKLALAFALAVAVPFASAADRRIISEHITVEEGETLRFAPGTEVLFGDMAGITVKGRLEALGTKEEPIKFASVHYTAGTASPFDWNGIEIVGVGHAALSNVHVSGATSGISSEKPRGLTLENCVFENNGQWHLQIVGEVVEVPDGEPYSFPAIAAPAPIKTPADITIDTSIDTSKYSNDISAEETLASDAERGAKKKSRLKLGIRLPAAALAAGGIAGGIYYNGKVGKAVDKYDKAASTLEAESARKTMEEAEKKYVPYRNTLYILGAVGLCGFTITFFF